MRQICGAMAWIESFAKVGAPLLAHAVRGISDGLSFFQQRLGEMLGLSYAEAIGRLIFEAQHYDRLMPPVSDGIVLRDLRKLVE